MSSNLTIGLHYLIDSNPKLQEILYNFHAEINSYWTQGGLQCLCSNITTKHGLDCPIEALNAKQYGELPARLDNSHSEPRLVLLVESDFTVGQIKTAIDEALALAVEQCLNVQGIDCLKRISVLLEELSQSHCFSPLKHIALRVDNSDEAAACLPSRLRKAKPSRIFPRNNDYTGLWSYLDRYLTGAEHWKFAAEVYRLCYSEMFSFLSASERNGRKVTLREAFHAAVSASNTVVDLLRALFKGPFRMCGRLVLLALAQPQLTRHRPLLSLNPPKNELLRDLLLINCLQGRRTLKRHQRFLATVRQTLCISLAGRNESRAELLRLLQAQEGNWMAKFDFCEIQLESIAADRIELPDFPVSRCHRQPIQAVLLFLSADIVTNIFDASAPLTAEANLLCHVWQMVHQQSSSDSILLIVTQGIARGQLLSWIQKLDLPDLASSRLGLIPFVEPKEWVAFRWLLTALRHSM
uniref:Protein SSH4 n=2 Tax=Macrostomum lignano TaxID=282301 RepID=A0A1I8H839_9PLAT